MLRPLELLYLALGVGIIVHGVLTRTMTVTTLGAGMFFIGLVPVTRADRSKKDTPGNALRGAVLAWLTKEDNRKGPGE